MQFSFVKPIAGLALASVLCGVPIAANAQQLIILPGYEVSQGAGASATGAGNDTIRTNSFGPWSHSYASPAGTPFGLGAASSSGSVTGTPSPLISGALSVSMVPGSVPAGFETDFVNGAAYDATLLYSFEVLGPTPTAQVQFHSLAHYATGAATPGTRFGAFVQTSVAQMDDGGGVVARVLTDTSSLHTFDDIVNASPDVTGSLATGFTGGFNDNGIYTFLTNTRYLVGLQFEIDMHINGFGGSDTFSGTLDPTFAIAPGFANAGAYSFIFSDGIGNAPLDSGGVPEPSAWAMMLLGFAGLGVAGRRRRARAPAAV